MPVTENGYTYEMCDGIRGQLDEDFLCGLHREVSGWYKKKHPETNDFSYYGFYVYIEGNGVWSESLKKVCLENNKQWIWEYWTHLPWYESDLFDDVLSTMMLKHGIIEEGEAFEDEVDQ